MGITKIVIGHIVNLTVPNANVVVVLSKEPVKNDIDKIVDETGVIEQRLNVLKKQTGKTKFDLSEIVFGYA